MNGRAKTSAPLKGAEYHNHQTYASMREKLWTLLLNPYEDDYKIEDDHKPITAHDRTTVPEFTTND
jgi:hypothetical protein